MQKLTTRELSELDTMRNQLDVMSNRVRDLFLQVVSDDECDPGFMTAARLSKVDSAFDVLDALLIDAVAEIETSLSATDDTGKVLRFRHKLTNNKG